MSNLSTEKPKFVSFFCRYSFRMPRVTSEIPRLVCANLRALLSENIDNPGASYAVLTNAANLEE